MWLFYHLISRARWVNLSSETLNNEARPMWIWKEKNEVDFMAFYPIHHNSAPEKISGESGQTTTSQTAVGIFCSNYGLS